MQSPQPRDLTIAICTIGRDGYLQAAIRSLIETTPPGVSFHLVLNAPTNPNLGPSLEPLLNEWNGPVKTTVLDERLTIAGSHNTALNAAMTDFVTFMGDDDLALEPRVEQILEKFAEFTPTPAVIGSFCRRVSGTGDSPRFSTNKDYGPVTIEDWEAVRARNELIEIVFPSAIYRTGLLKEIGGFEERFGSAMDLATFTILAQDHPVLADPRRTFAHRIHDGSVTTSAASQHVQRLRYTERCMSALRSGQTQPTWDEFIFEEEGASRLDKLLVGRDVSGAALFRAGGAALASGNVFAGIAKIGKSAVVSPRTFAKRLRSQTNRDQASEALVVFSVDERAIVHADMLTDLRSQLREQSVELRLVTPQRATSSSDQESAVPSWFESPPVWQLSLLGRSWETVPLVDIGPKPDLLVLTPHSGAQRRWSQLMGSWRSVCPQALWVRKQDLPLQGAYDDVVWYFAEDDESVAASSVVEISEFETTQLFDSSTSESPAQLFSDGIVAAIERLR